MLREAQHRRAVEVHTTGTNQHLRGILCFSEKIPRNDVKQEKSIAKRWAYILTGLLILALCVCLGRAQIKHAAVAYEIYHLQTFTPPPIRSGESRLHQHWANAQFYWDFADIPLSRDKRLQLLNPALRPLVQEIARD